ncbi:MAG: hypothetical protein OXH52_00610 [Gammaproteobacteria bacterium]|nr:hypothetical protein [Gammaproteobacteria bacterium]
MYIVASSLDSATQRIVEYLSRMHGVDGTADNNCYLCKEQLEALIGLLVNESVR